MKFDPPLLTEGPLSGRVYVVTHGKIEPHPTFEGQTMVTASVKYDVTEQFEALTIKRRSDPSSSGPLASTEPPGVSPLNPSPSAVSGQEGGE